MPALIALITAAACALAVVAPALGDPAVLGLGYNDLHGTLWFRWQLLTSLEQGLSVSVTPLLAAPIGTDLLARNGVNLLDAALSLPLVATLGPYAGHDAWAAALVAANVLAFWRMGEAFSLSTAARALGGALFALSPILLSEIGGGRPTQAFLPFLCLGLAQAWRVDERPRAWAWMGLHLALTGLTYWFAAIWGGLLLALVGAQRSPRKTAMALGLSLLLVSPWLLAYASRASGDAPLPGMLGAKDFLPLAVMWWDGQAAMHTVEGELVLSPRAMAPVAGFELLLGTLALLVLAWRRRSWRPLALASALCLAFAAGPHPFDLLPNPVYALWLSLGSLARRMWFPTRALVVPALLAALALAASLDESLKHRPRLTRWLAPALTLLWLGGLFARSLLPLPTWTPPRPSALRWLAQEPPGAVIALPDLRDSTWMVHQIEHGKPVQRQVGGQNPLLAVSAWDTWAEGHPAIAILETVLDGKVPPRDLTPEELDALRDEGFGYVLIDFGDLNTRRSPKAIQTTRRRLERLLGPSDYSASELYVWRLAPSSDARSDP